jgi:SAM-dependent methyltransferase
MTLDATGPNAQQIEYWNAQSASKWVALQSLLDQQLGPLGLATIERAELAAGERVLDIGCGCGQSSLQLAERVAPGGSVLGIDVATAMLERARERALELGLGHVRFENADAQTFAFAPASFDLAFSRFGVMFFADPVAAFANVRAALAPGGRLSFLCWQEIGRNPWVRVPLMAAAKHVPLPEPRPRAGRRFRAAHRPAGSRRAGGRRGRPARGDDERPGSVGALRDARWGTPRLRGLDRPRRCNRLAADHRADPDLPAAAIGAAARPPCLTPARPLRRIDS